MLQECKHFFQKKDVKLQHIAILYALILNQLSLYAYIHNIIRCCLVNKVIQPIGKEQIRMATPTHNRFIIFVIILKIINRHFDRQPKIFIAQVFIF